MGKAIVHSAKMLCNNQTPGNPSQGSNAKDSILKLGRHIVKNLLEGWLHGIRRPSARIGHCSAFATGGSVTDKRFAECLTEHLAILLQVRYPL